MKIVVFYVGSSLLSPLRQAEREINRSYNLDLQVAAHNCGAPLDAPQLAAVETDTAESDIVFIIHVTDSENAAHITNALAQNKNRHKAVIAINCMPDLMRQTRLGKLDLQQMMKGRGAKSTSDNGAKSMVKKASTWMADFARHRKNGNGSKTGGHNLGSYRKLIDQLPKILRFVPTAGKLGDIKHYLFLFCYFLQPTPTNIRSMLLYAIKFYVPYLGKRINVAAPEIMPAGGIYHPDAPKLFDSFASYKKWYQRRSIRLDSDNTVGLLLMRPQIISGAAKHYDGLIRAIENEGLAVIPAISTFMDNREAAAEFFIEGAIGKKTKQSANGAVKRPRVSQILSLTGFSFVGGP